MIEILKQIDTWLLLLINGWHSPFFDSVMWAISTKTVWIPLYLLLLYLLYSQYKKEAFLIFLSCIVAVALADSLSVALFKDVFMRFRPSHNPSLEGMVHIVNNYKGGNYGFISSHAANTFAVAFFINHFLKRSYSYFTYLIFSWAALVCYSRIYLGVHYPGDILGGAAFGSFIAFIIIKVYVYIKTLR